MLCALCCAVPVFPTPVGMNRGGERFELAAIGVPHARGDEPAIEKGIECEGECSPRPWG